MIMTYSNATSAKMVTDAYYSIQKRNQIRKEHGLPKEIDLTVEGICRYLKERRIEMEFKVPKLSGFLKGEGVSDPQIAEEVGKRLFVIHSLKANGLEVDQGITYTIKQIDNPVIDLVIRFLHGKNNMASNPIARLLNISDQKAYTATSRWDSEVAGKKQIKREDAGKPSVFAPIPEATNLEIDRLIREGRMGDREIAELTRVSVASVQNRRSRKNEKETVKIMERAKKVEEKVEEVGPSDVFGIAMFPKERTDSAKQALRA
ncbi:MAG: hypothetical protein KGH59_04640 [Candidatus Micrarchaeota archaeon]|nr:hypothetical protein [Candidatus Micrarchaeota archaeon]MDE1805037.1 hypothetical protein [Candidatus Micrarchaeota archaeon]MDE1828038.1 hypothetical protein [Candidatus Micrarchaeota archaeon]